MLDSLCLLHYFQSSTCPGCNKGNEVDESSKKARKPELVNSEDNENSRGAVGQVLSLLNSRSSSCYIKNFLYDFNN